MRRWVEDINPEWQLEHDESAGPIRGAALPMGFNRTPLYADGLLLVGDSGGMVNPFNGEGIDYALEAARLGAELVAQAMARPGDAARERVLATYPKVMKHELGGYFTLGRWFAHAIGNPEVMRLATKYGLPRTKLMPLLLKIMANLADPTSKGASDRLVTALSRMAPSA
jgi:flavin-dependent dehydrogenase